MRSLDASLLERGHLWSALATLRLRVPGFGRAAPGQYVLASLPDRRDPLLSRPHLIVGQHQPADTVEVLATRPADPRWSAGLQAPASPLRLTGPAGRPFAIDGRTRHALLIGGGPGLGPLLFLARELAMAGLEVTFLGQRDGEGAAMPGSLLPPEVEYLVPPRTEPAEQQPALLQTVDTLVAWADQLFLAVPEEALPAVLNLLRRKLLRLRKGFAQALVVPDLLPCGVGACDLCAMRTREGLRRPCRDGLVFDLLSLI